MNEYIERNAIINHLKDLPTYWADGGGIYGKAMSYPNGMFDCEDVISSLENAPAADVAPVRHGQWIGRPLCGNDNCQCSECGFLANIHVNLRGVVLQKYCPTVGMRCKRWRMKKRFARCQ